MTYYKITYESNTIEGLKAIQGGFPGSEASATGSATSENPGPPPTKQDQENSDAFAGVVQAPPTADEAVAGLGFTDENAFFPPPPTVADSASMDFGLEADIPPPPLNEFQN